MDVNLIRFTQEVFPSLILKAETDTVKKICQHFPAFMPPFMEYLGSKGYFPRHFQSEGYRVSGSEDTLYPSIKYFHVLTLPFDSCNESSLGTAKQIIIVTEDSSRNDNHMLSRYFSFECAEKILDDWHGYVIVAYEYYFDKEGRLKKRKWRDYHEESLKQQVSSCEDYLFEAKCVAFNGWSSQIKA